MKNNHTMKRSLWLLMVLVCLILHASGDKHRNAKQKNKRKLNASAVMQDMSRMQANITKLWDEMEHIKHDHMKYNKANVSVSISGVEGEEMASTQDASGTHVHVHLHMDTLFPGQVNAEKGQVYSKEYKMKHHIHLPEPDEYVYAVCNMKPNPTLDETERNRITGVIQMRQKLFELMEVRVHLRGFNMTEGMSHHHGFHVHQFGDISAGCASFGGHYNPDDTMHGGPHDKIRHVGDWGNVMCDENGEVHSNFTDTQAQLIGHHSVLGRGIVLHHNRDDLGKGGTPASKLSGNAGSRLACCTIAWAKEQDWEKHF